MSLAHDDIGQGTPVVLLHAFPLSRQMWRPQRDALAARCRLITPDLPGFGDSALSSDAHRRGDGRRRRRPARREAASPSR